MRMITRITYARRLPVGCTRWLSVPARAPPVSAYDVECYQRDGAVLLRGVLPPDAVALLADGIADNLAAPGPLAGVASAATDPGRFFEDFCNWQRIPQYEDFVRGSALPEIAALLMGSSAVRMHHDHLLVKEPGTAQATPWHQDQPYYNISGRDNVSFWIPIDLVPRESSLQFVAGSHTGVWFMPKTFLTEQALWFPPGSLEEVPDIDGDRSRYDILSWDVAPGDVVAFHMLTLHGSAGSAGMRRAFSLRFIGDDVRHAPRSWRTSPEFPGLVDELPAGAEMDHPLFPVLYTNA